MKSRRPFWTGLSIPIFLAFSLGACSPEIENERASAEMRWRVTVTITTPDGERTGSSVWSWTLSKPSIALATPFDGKFVGEAVAVDLPNGKTVFALLDGTTSSPSMLPERQFYDETRGMRDRLETIRFLARRIGDTRSLPCEVRGPDDRIPKFRFDCLKLAAFEDLNDPSSIFVVDYHDAEATLGEGYQIKDISIAITDAAVSTGIEGRLPWYRSEDLTVFDWSDVPSEIFIGDFRRNFKSTK